MIVVCSVYHGVWVLGPEVRVQVWVSSPGCRVSHLVGGSWDLGMGIRVHVFGAGFRASGLGYLCSVGFPNWDLEAKCRGLGVGFRVQGLWLRVLGSGFGVKG